MKAEIENFYDKFFGTCYWEKEYKPHIVEFCRQFTESQLEKERLKLNTDDPYKYVLTNPKGDTFTFNPQRGIGEELNDFLYGYFLTQTKEDEEGS